MAQPTDRYIVATYENDRFTGYLSDNGKTSWTLTTACRLARDFTEKHAGTSATVAICPVHN